jgi:hypothetical protein
MGNTECWTRLHGCSYNEKYEKMGDGYKCEDQCDDPSAGRPKEKEIFGESDPTKAPSDDNCMTFTTLEALEKVELKYAHNSMKYILMNTEPEWTNFDDTDADTLMIKKYYTDVTLGGGPIAGKLQYGSFKDIATPIFEDIDLQEDITK